MLAGTKHLREVVLAFPRFTRTTLPFRTHQHFSSYFRSYFHRTIDGGAVGKAGKLVVQGPISSLVLPLGAKLRKPTEPRPRFRTNFNIRLV